MTDVRRIFVDTNVLVFAAVPRSEAHHAARATLARLDREGAELWVSRQVIREYLAVMTRQEGFRTFRPSDRHPSATLAMGRAKAKG